ncbi:MAG TPA: fibronectin type III-like domain-contianing protein, partial [Aeromicrobium sp.]|nr:fibronectin type III-like domain-contianing protein [Aeromicrobium sp.]
TFTVTNTGDRAGADVPQLYLTEAAGDKRQRLRGFERVELQPGESRQVTVTADPRLLARFDGNAGHWHIAAGTYKVAVGKNAEHFVLETQVSLGDRQFGY